MRGMGVVRVVEEETVVEETAAAVATAVAVTEYEGSQQTRAEPLR